MRVWVQGILVLLLVVVTACNQQVNDQNYWTGEEIYESVAITIDNPDAQLIIKELLESMVVNNGLITLDTSKVPDTVSITEMYQLVSNLNEFVLKNDVLLHSPEDLLFVYNTYSGPSLSLPEKENDESLLEDQQVGAYDCRGVKLMNPHKSHLEVNTIKAKAAGSCQFHQTNLASPTWKLYMYLEIRRGALFKYWSKVGQAGPYTRYGYTPRWSESSAVVRTTPCVNGDYRATGSISISVPNATVWPSSFNLVPTTSTIRC